MENKINDNHIAKEILSNVLNNTWAKDVNTLSKNLPIKAARAVKTWRVEEEQSWRSIATLFTQKFPEESGSLNIISGNQISGMQLCEAAMKKLKETIDQGWN